ncbi:MAG TPA: 3-oxoacyl-ACP reductase [Rhodospirillaceae bacterium]|nr:3-oxoacyl-ACP reductase [Rhodospirillaceae bacterium]|tara:strand:- start:70 stop:849 length:780 start_codon:yes stop_codon:yes gene_type:complete
MSTVQNDDTKSPSLRVDGLVAVVTGAGRGLGRSIALALAESGAELVLISRTQSDLHEVAERIADAGGSARAIVCDVTDAAQVTERIESLERIDILMNNAGANIPEPFIDVTEEHLDFLMEINVKSMFLVAQAAARRMLANGHGGSIIHMSSQMGHVGSPNRTNYCTTKHAVEGLSKAIAAELAPHNIRSNCIGPTFIETPMTKPMFENPEFREFVMNRIPMGRLGKISDVTGAVVFLASPASELITGASLTIDGGWTVV